MIYMFLSNNPSSGDINSSNLSCLSCDLLIRYCDSVSLVSFSYSKTCLKLPLKNRQNKGVKDNL